MMIPATYKLGNKTLKILCQLCPSVATIGPVISSALSIHQAQFLDDGFCK
jgi:hypothetical protein